MLVYGILAGNINGYKYKWSNEINETVVAYGYISAI